jgi:cell division transport system permease protein
MAVSVDYVTRETASNLWRNRLMTIAAVLTVAVSLSLVGASLLMRQGVARATTQWQHGVNVLVFLDAQSPAPAQLTSSQKAIDQQLVQLPFVRTCVYRDQQYDYNEALRLLGSDVGQGLSVDTTPSSLRCALDNPNELFAVQKEFKGYPGINDVVGPTQQVKSMEKVIHVLQWVFLGVAVILLLSASVLILNTIRLAIFARRREVSVMKLVGATNWFIRVPFMCEGLVQGMLGALVAASAVFGLHWILNDLSSNRTSFLFQMRMPTSEALVTCLVVLVVGVVIGSLGSALGIRRFLDA